MTSLARPGRQPVDLALAALADPYRRAAIDLLGKSPRTAGDLARGLGLEPPAMSRHLKILRQAGLVEESHPEFDARVRIITLRAGGLTALTAWIKSTEDLWVDEKSPAK